MRFLIPLILIACFCSSMASDWTHAPDRQRGSGPHEQLILRGGILIDGTGAPATGPVDIIIENNRIVKIEKVGVPGLPIDEAARPKLKKGGVALDVTGMHILPGFVDMHGHIGGKYNGAVPEYVYKLWMAHGITTIRDPGCYAGLDWTLVEKERSIKNKITAPRIFAYLAFGHDQKNPFTTPQAAIDWVNKVADQGADGLKFFGYRPDIMKAALEQAKKRGLRTATHHAQIDVARVNVLDTAKWGLTTMEHWYGLPEALFVDRTVQNYPHDYNYMNEQDRFGEAGRLWQQASPPGSPRWQEVQKTLLGYNFTIVPTFTIYEASRDLMRARRAEWHETYTLPSLWDWFAPNRDSHGSYWFSWSTSQEIAWKKNYQIWMQFINEYKNQGGRVCVGSDSGFIYKLFGFGYIREFELLQEAGFHPLEVIRSATLYGAQALGQDQHIGSIEPGKLADLVVVQENPLSNFKVLYGTGAIKLNEKNEPVRTKGIRYTIKDGIVYDAKELLADVAKMVSGAWKKEGRTLTQPGMK